MHSYTITMKRLQLSYLLAAMIWCNGFTDICDYDRTVECKVQTHHLDETSKQQPAVHGKHPRW